MKKLIIVSLISLSIFIPKLQSISVAEYIQQNGIPLQSNGYYDRTFTLDFSRKNLTSLEGLQDVLQGIPTEVLAQVKYLDLSWNQLSELPAGIFNGLSKLKHLYISNNQLQELPIGVFNGLNSLEQLILRNNKLQTLPAGIFNGLSNLHYLNLSDNQLQEVSTGIFDGLRNLRSLFIFGNRIKILPFNIFNGLQRLDTLSLGNNQLKALPNGIFDGLGALHSLWLEGNAFTMNFLLNFPALIRSIPSLKFIDKMTTCEALKSGPYCVYNPKTLQEITKEYAMQHLTHKELEQLAEVNRPAFDLLPLSQDERQAILERKKIQFMTQVLAESLGWTELTPEQLEELAEVNRPVFDLLHLSKAQRQSILNKVEERKKVRFMAKVLAESLSQATSANK